MADDSKAGDSPDVHSEKPKQQVEKPCKCLLSSFVTLSSAQGREEDMVEELQYSGRRAMFFTRLKDELMEIKEVLASHLGLNSVDQLYIPDMIIDGRVIWKHGSFNVCIPVTIIDPKGSLPTKVAFRVPIWYKLGELMSPGNMEEKVRSEAATYIWIAENCPDVPIPKLRGFGVPDGLTFYHSEYISIWQWVKFSVWRLYCRLTTGSKFSEFIPLKRNLFLTFPYMIIDWIEDDSEMLSCSFKEPHTEQKTENLYRGLSRIMISLANIPQPRIGSWTIDNDGRISLSNRPMDCTHNMLENWFIPVGIPRNMTYVSANDYYTDLLTVHDNRLKHQKNAVFSAEDARGQAKDLVLMRALLHFFTSRHLRYGPFAMQLTDMHASNIFVDKDWNIKHIIDLEWACSLPVETLLPPTWLSGVGCDEIEGAEYEKFSACYQQFVRIFKDEAKREPHPPPGIYYAVKSMKKALNSRHYWYFNALQTPKGLFPMFRQHIQSMFSEEESKAPLRGAVSSFWTPNMASFVDSKLKHYTQYQKKLQSVFDDEKLTGKAYNANGEPFNP